MIIDCKRWTNTLRLKTHTHKCCVLLELLACNFWGKKNPHKSTCFECWMSCFQLCTLSAHTIIYSYYLLVLFAQLFIRQSMCVWVWLDILFLVYGPSMFFDSIWMLIWKFHAIRTAQFRYWPIAIVISHAFIIIAAYDVDQQLSHECATLIIAPNGWTKHLRSVRVITAWCQINESENWTTPIDLHTFWILTRFENVLFAISISL